MPSINYADARPDTKVILLAFKLANTWHHSSPCHTLTRVAHPLSMRHCAHLCWTKPHGPSAWTRGCPALMVVSWACSRSLPFGCPLLNPLLAACKPASAAAGKRTAGHAAQALSARQRLRLLLSAAAAWKLRHLQATLTIASIASDDCRNAYWQQTPCFQRGLCMQTKGRHLAGQCLCVFSCEKHGTILRFFSGESTHQSRAAAPAPEDPQCRRSPCRPSAANGLPARAPAAADAGPAPAGTATRACAPCIRPPAGLLGWLRRLYTGVWTLQPTPAQHESLYVGFVQSPQQPQRATHSVASSLIEIMRRAGMRTADIHYAC